MVNSARVDAYDLATNQWQALGTLPTTVSNQAVVAQGEWLWLVGDFTNQGYLAAYNTRTGQLRSFTSNLPPRRNAAAAIYNNNLYVWGGNTAASNASTLADMWVANVSTVLAVDPGSASPQVHIYPNPSSKGLVTLALPAEAQQVRVLDGLGRLLKLAPLPAGLTRYALDLREQPAGLYVVQVQTKSGRVATCRLVQQ
ncbi:T9SS type A sorting domain-containing protein [Hymenobacter ginkgonis]|uniref:T9SS type A sorting domain-containing protein n=1 Tax=Hymenobacter ginkgonis TaxID=2682976 RepID=UPI0018DBA9A7|nr:T9SS type A sorting domain-containing protein [Hymenobacter ginkgonis]